VVVVYSVVVVGNVKVWDVWEEGVVVLYLRYLLGWCLWLVCYGSIIWGVEEGVSLVSTNRCVEQ